MAMGLNKWIYYMYDSKQEIKVIFIIIIIMSHY